MNRRTDRPERIEEMLRNHAPGARRDPSPALRARILATVGSGASRAAAGDRGGEEWHDRSFTWRESGRNLVAAASVLVAAGFWIFAIVGVMREGPAPAAGSLPTAVSGRLPSLTSPGAFEQLARATPQALSSAVDDSLLSELADIAEDASRAARFLAGRVPAPLGGGGADSLRVHRAESFDDR